MKKLTLAERIQRYVAKHPDVDPRLKVYMKTPDGQYVHVVSGEPMPSAPTGRGWYYAFDRYCTRQNGLHTCAYMDVDTKLGIYEMSIVNVCTKSFKKFPAPRQPVWVSRRFYEIGQQTPYNENGDGDSYYHIYRNDMDTDWSGAQRLGQGVTFLTMFARRVGMANDGVKLTDCLGDVFYDGHWKKYDYNECHEYSWGPAHTYNDWTWFCRFFETKRPTGTQPVPKQHKIPPLTNKLVETVKNQIREGELSLSPLSDDVFFGKVYDKYNVLYKREEFTGYQGLKRVRFFCSMWNPDSTVCRVYGDLHHTLLLDEIAKLPKGPQLLECHGITSEVTVNGALNIGYYFKFLNPIYESLVKIYPDTRVWGCSLQDMFGSTRVKPKALHQKLGISKQQLNLWLSTSVNSPKSIGLIRAAKDYTHKKNISSMSIAATLDAYFSNQYPYKYTVPVVKEFFDIREGTRKQEVFFKWLFERENQPKFYAYNSPLGDACRMASQLRDAQELTGNLNISFNKMLSMTEKELTQWHDDVTRAYQRMQDRIRAAKDVELWKTCQNIDKSRRKKWEYEEGNYLIRVPKSLGEIREEGAIQHICIGSYTEMHATGQTNLLFVRKKDNPDQPFLAIEVRGNRINQIHGKHNAWVASVDPNAVPMLYRWVEKNNLQCEDRILLLQADSYGGYGTMMAKPKY